MANWEMKLGAPDPHHRELQVNISYHMITSHMRHLWADPQFEEERCKNMEFSQ